MKNNNNNNNNNNNTIDNYDITNTKLFYKIFKNNILKNIILKQLSIFKIFNKNYISVNNASINSLLSCRYFFYCKSFIIKDFDNLIKLSNDIDKLQLSLFKELEKSQIKILKGYFKNSTITHLSITLNNKSKKNKLKGILKNLPIHLKTLEINIDHLTIDENDLNHTYQLKELIINGNNIRIKENSIPISVNELTINSNQDFLNENYFNKNLKIINFGDDFNGKFNLKTFNKCKELNSISFGKNFNKSIQPFLFPQSLEKLLFSKDSLFNQPLLVNSIPTNCKIIKFGSSFSQELFILKFNHNSINSDNGDWDINGEFNFDIYSSILPPNLLNLELGENFKGSILKGLLTNVETLTFNGSSIKVFQNDSIPNIKSIKLPKTIELFGDRLLTNSIENIEIVDTQFTIDQKQTFKFPTSLSNLKFNGSLSNILLIDLFQNNQLYNLNSFKFTSESLNETNSNLSIINTVNELELNFLYYENINQLNLPSNIEKMIIKGRISTPFAPSFFIKSKNTLKHLEIKQNGTGTIFYAGQTLIPKSCIPSTVETLVFDEIHDIKLIKNLKFDNNISTLKFGTIFNATPEELKSIIPNQIQTLEFNDSVGLLDLNDEWLPKNLKNIHINHSSLILNPIPKSLEKIYFYHIMFLFYNLNNLNILNENHFEYFNY